VEPGAPPGRERLPRPPGSHRLRRWLLGAWVVALLGCALAVGALWARDPQLQPGVARAGDREGAISPACRGAWSAAAGMAREDRSVQDLDVAVRVCRSLEEWRRAADRYPRALAGGDAIEHLARRCRSAPPALSGTRLCRAV
jgi:hypothetical protein